MRGGDAIRAGGVLSNSEVGLGSLAIGEGKLLLCDVDYGLHALDVATGRLLAAEALCGRKTAFTAQVIPAVVFSDPEIATVGLTDEQATAEGIEPITRSSALSATICK